MARSEPGHEQSRNGEVEEEDSASGTAPKGLSNWQLIVFSGPAIPLAALGIPMGFFLPPFFTGELGMSLTMWSFILFVGRIFDIVTDPVAGVLCDRYPSRWGRRRHWLVIGTPIMMVACALLFLPDLFTDNVTVVYAILALCLYQLGHTIYGLNGNAWGAELTDDYHERSRVMGWRSILGALAPFFVLGISATVELTLPDAKNREKLFYIALFVLPMLPLLTGLAVAFVGERPNRVLQNKDRISLLESWRLLVTNLIMLRLIVIEIMAALPFAINVAVNYFYVAYVLEAPSLMSTLILFPFAGILLSMPIWVRLSRHFEKHRLLTFTYAMGAVTSILMLFPGPGDALPYGVIIFFLGVFTAGPSFLMRSIVADVVDSDLLATGEQRTGTFFALVEMTQKMIPAVAVFLAYPFLEWMGFDPRAAENTPESIDAIRYVYGLFPPLPMLIAGWLLFTFPLGKSEQEELRRQIDERQAPPR